MSSAVAAELWQRVRQRAAQDPDAVRPVLQVLVGDAPAVSPATRAVAGTLNVARVRAAREDLVGAALTTEQVATMLGGISRQAVHARRRRGTLVGLEHGNAVYHPAWQFAGHRTHPALPEVLARLRSFTTDVVAADRVMRLPRPEHDGRSLADLLADGDDEAVLNALDRLGGGF